MHLISPNKSQESVVQHHALLPCHHSRHSFSDGPSHTLWNNLWISSTHCTCNLRLLQHCIIICKVHCNMLLETAPHDSLTYGHSHYFSTTCVDIFDTLYMPPTPFTTFYNRLHTLSVKTKFAETASRKI